MTTRTSPRSLAAVGLAILGLLLQGCSSGEGNNASMSRPAPVVTVKAVSPDSAELVQEYPARVRGAREVEVRARVSGILLERAYQEGERVEQGDLLFRIDPAPMQLQVKQAQAAQANARAELLQAQRDWARAEQLFGRGVISTSERDRARSQLDFAEAGMAQAEARLDEAELNLSYTEVRAPVSGATSLEVQPEGSLIELGSLMTTLVQQDPVHVIFALPERDLAIQRAAGLDGNGSGQQVALELPDGSDYSLSGRVDFTSSRIDPATGTITLRAVFDNPQLQLITGQFVRVRVVLSTFNDEILIPADALGASPEGPSVFVVDQELKVERRAVRLGPVIGDRQIISAGLEAGERVVVNGHVGLQPGMQVRLVGQGEG